MLELRGITKKFGDFIALHQINFAIQPGEIAGLLGENGAGKSTLMNLVGGVFQPSGGQILLDQKPLKLTSPRQATALGIGVVHQHFMLVPGFTVAENVALHTEKKSSIFNAPKWNQLIAEWAENLGWNIDGSRLVEDLSVGERQRVEILKALFGSTGTARTGIASTGTDQKDHLAKILLLDEPTANLTPQESEELFGVLRGLRDRGCGIVFVSHKLQEVLSLCSRVVVLQHGKITGERVASQTNASELARLMVGREVKLLDEIPLENSFSQSGQLQNTKPILKIENLKSGMLHNFSLQVNAGEIVGLAGVDGNGQRELFEALAGLSATNKGAIKVLSSKPPAFVPPDRGTEGLISTFDIAENLALNGTLRKQAKSTFWFNWESVQNETRRLMTDFDVRAPQTKERTLAGQLSGGNQQKVVLARVLRFGAELVVAMDPTRGLDVAAAAFVHEQLREAANEGTAILLISTDLDEVLALSHRIGVLYEGELLPDENLFEHGADRLMIGELMGGNKRKN